MNAVTPKRGGLPIAIESILYALECDNIGCDRLRAAIQAALDEARWGRHTHRAEYADNRLLDCCGLCSLDLRNAIHLRVGESR